MTPRVLVVDDDPALRALLRESILHHGVEVETTGDLRAADRWLLSFAPALVVLDLSLPDGDGADWLAAARGRGWDGLAVVVSGTLDDPAKLMRLRAQFRVRRVFHKPVVPSALAAYVAELVGAHPAGPVAEPSPSVELDAAFHLLRAEYVASLPEQLQDLRNAVIDPTPDTSTSGDVVRALAHRLAGTAGSYGLAEVGVAAAALERGAARGPDRDRATLDHALTDLERTVHAAVERAAKGPVPPSSSRGRVLVVAADGDHQLTWLEAGRRMLVNVDVARSIPSRTTLEASGIRGLVVHEGASAVTGLDQLATGNLRVARVSRDASTAARLRWGGGERAAFVLAPVDLPAAEQVLAQLVAQAADPPRVLVVDDDPAFGALVGGVLREAGMEVATLASGEQLFELLDRFRPDAVVLDEDLQRLRGSDLCRAVRACSRWQTLPILVLTRMAGDDVRRSVYACGADDYLEKPLDAQELLARLRARIRRAAELAERYDRDQLTGLLNRRVFTEQLTARLASARRAGTPLAVAILDIDHFKAVNDRFGHSTGDTVLAGLGRLIGARFRAEDVRGRWGGEEFVLALPGLCSRDAARVLDILRQQFMALSVETEDGLPVSVTFSCGVSVFPDDGTSVGRLVAEADRRLYLAKTGGRNRVVLAG